MSAPGRDGVAVVSALAVYRARIVPRVRRELRRWRGVAESIPDPGLRDQALTALDEKGLNVEATAVFATLAPRRTRPAAIRAMVALQVAIDYLDTLGEQLSAGDAGYLDRLFGAYRRLRPRAAVPRRRLRDPRARRLPLRRRPGIHPRGRARRPRRARGLGARAGRPARSTAGGRSPPGPAPRSRRTR